MVLRVAAGIDHSRDFDVPGKQEKGEENRDVDEDGPEHSLAQPRPAPLVFELADHLQQFVGVVVDPARTARDGRARLLRAPGQGRARFGDPA